MTESGTRSAGIELTIALDRGRGSLRRQLEDALRAAIRDETLPGGTSLPSSRTLAGDLGVSRRLVVETYAQLTAEGYLATAPRAHTRVSEIASASVEAAPRPPADAPLYDLRPGTPDLGGFPRAVWRRANAAILRNAPDDALRYPDPRGSPELRTAVAQYLRRVRAVDAEFRYDQTPLSALQGLAPEHVAYVGSVSKTLSPALRLGWLVLPTWLVEPCVEAKRFRDGGAATLPQLTLAHLIASGDYDRHLRRARRRYRARRDALVRALQLHLPAAHVTGMSAGLHVLVTLPSDVDMQALDDSARRRRLTIAAVGQFRLAPRTDDPALVLGYANLSDAGADRAVRLLAEAITDATG